MNINFWGVVHGTQAFLPHLRATGEGHIVNISSVFGLVSIPMQSAYNASKFGVRGFTDALRMELEIEPCGVSSTTIHPGGIKTNIARNARTDESAMLGGATHEEMADDFDRLARTTRQGPPTRSSSRSSATAAGPRSDPTPCCSTSCRGFPPGSISAFSSR